MRSSSPATVAFKWRMSGPLRKFLDSAEAVVKTNIMHISLAAVMSTASCFALPQPATCSSPWTFLEAKLAHESREGLTMETCDLMSLAGSLPFQSATLWREISPLIVSSIVSYFYYYVHFETRVTIWDIWALVTDTDWMNARKCDTTEREVMTFMSL